jgi:hypothetical protein
MRRPLESFRTGVALICAATLVACGGGGGSDGSADASTSLDTATRYAANATEMGADAGIVLDAGVVATQVVAAAQASAAAAPGGLARSLATAPQPAVDVLVSCPSGGTALLSISGGTPSTQINGTFDAGEVYQITFTRCMASTGGAALDGALSVTVQSATPTGQTLVLGATGLAATLPGGSVSLTGGATQIQTTTTDASGASVVTRQFTSPSLSLATQFNGRTGSFTVSAVDLTRTSTSVAGVQQSSSLRGTHTLSTTVAGATVSYTVATQGSVSYSVAGQPVAGAWTLTLLRTLVGVTLGGGEAVITVDDGKDGTIDRTVTVPLGNFLSALG